MVTRQQLTQHIRNAIDASELDIDFEEGVIIEEVNNDLEDFATFTITIGDKSFHVHVLED